MLAQTISQNQQTAEVIRRSIRYAMLQNHREQVAQIIEAVSRTRGIEKIRIFDKEGEIITSTLPSEIGTRVDKAAEACFHCHNADRPLQQLPGNARHRIYRSNVGHRILGTIDVIRNEPACSTADCHAHPESVTVLGVLDVAYSLDAFDASESGDLLAVVGLTAALAIVIFIAVTLAVNRLVYQPLGDLEAGARLVSAGDRTSLIPVRRHDEIGHLAESFNLMTLALQRSEHDLAEWAHTLEQKVEEKTGELRLAEAQTVQAEKLASVGLLAAGIAHEINNPLTGVLTFAHLVRANLPEGSAEAEDMDIIIRETKRCAGIIRRLLDFAREKKPEVISRRPQRRDPRDHPVRRAPGRLPERGIRARTGPVAARDLDGPEPAQAGHHEPGRQRPGRDGRARPPPRSLAPPPDPVLARRGTTRGPRGRADLHGHRLRHPGGGPAEDLRPLLHLQGARQGRGAGALGRLQHHQGARRHDRGRERNRPRHHVPHRSARGGRIAGERGGKTCS